MTLRVEFLEPSVLKLERIQVILSKSFQLDINRTPFSQIIDRDSIQYPIILVINNNFRLKIYSSTQEKISLTGNQGEILLVLSLKFDAGLELEHSDDLKGYSFFKALPSPLSYSDRLLSLSDELQGVSERKILLEAQNKILKAARAKLCESLLPKLHLDSRLSSLTPMELQLALESNKSFEKISKLFSKIHSTNSNLKKILSIHETDDF
jgi:hypothetical protein